METINPCPNCGDNVDPRRVALGYRYCLSCGETRAKQVKHCIVPMPKSNYIVVTDMALLIGLNTSHKGGVR
jgi:ribosomal protein L37AE/L43A